MKTNVVVLLLAGFLAMFTASCSSSDDPKVEVTGITLDQSTLEIEVEESAALVATLAPEGVTGEITWSSSNPAVAAVNGGVVTALSAGNTTVVATHGAFSASCEVTVKAKVPPLHPTLKGSNYTIIHLDEASSTLIADKIVNDLRPDDTNKFLYVWDGTFTAGTPNGLNFYGLSDGWVSLVVGGAGWSGAGYFVGAAADPIDMTDMYNNPDDYVFHIGMKSSQASSSYLFIFSDGTTEAKICVGSAAYVDNGTTFEPYADFTRDNEWHSVEIPASKLRDMGVFYNQPFNDVNAFAFLAGGVQGTTMDIDACFFYKKPVTE